MDCENINSIIDNFLESEVNFRKELKKLINAIRETRERLDDESKIYKECTEVYPSKLYTPLVDYINKYPKEFEQKTKQNHSKATKKLAELKKINCAYWRDQEQSRVLLSKCLVKAIMEAENFLTNFSKDIEPFKNAFKVFSDSVKKSNIFDNSPKDPINNAKLDHTKCMREYKEELYEALCYTLGDITFGELESMLSKK